MKYIIGVLIFISLVILLIAIPKGRTLKISYALDKMPLNPLNIRSKYDKPMIYNIYRPLIYWKTFSDYKSDMIREIKTISDTEYLFFLNKDFKFSNGHQLTSNDILYTFATAKKYPNFSCYKVTNCIKKIVRIDKYTVKIIINKKYFFFNKIFEYFFVIPDHWNVKFPPPASGPYEIEEKSNDKVILEKNKYFDAKERYSKVIIYYSKPNTKLKEILKNRSYDIIITKKNIKISNLRRYNIYKIPLNEMSILFFNFANKKFYGHKNKFINLKIRQRFFNAIDYSLIDKYMKNFNAIYEVKKLAISYYLRDLKKYESVNSNDNVPLTLDIDIPDNIKIFFDKIITKPMREHNIFLNVHVYKWNKLYNKIKQGDSVASILSLYSSDFDPAEFFGELFFSYKNNTFGKYNFFNYKNKEMDNNIKALCVLTGDKRIRKGWEMMDKALKNKLFVPLYEEDLFVIVNNSKCHLRNKYKWGDLLNYD